MKETFYYIRDSKFTEEEFKKFKGKVPEKICPHPRVTICLIKCNGNIIARGISICSLDDGPNKKEGQRLAKYNALWAIKHKKSGRLITREKAINALQKIDHLGTHFKAYYDARPINEFEEKLFESLLKK